ncbi:MAG: MerR family transcriptional regulator [Candidatus Halichondribacter symbioticus]
MKKSPQAFRTISEVANWLDTQTHVLRFWESKFKQIKPIKRAGRRYYRPQDMQVLGGIKALLHGQGLTIKHVQGLLAEQGISAVVSLSPDLNFAGADKVELVEEVVVEEVVANETVEEVVVEEVVANETVDEVVANEITHENESVNETITEVAEDLPPLLDAMGAPTETPANTPSEILTDSPTETPTETPLDTPSDTPANTLTQDELKNIYHQLKDIRNRMGRSLAAISQ